MGKRRPSYSAVYLVLCGLSLGVTATAVAGEITIGSGRVISSSSAIHEADADPGSVRTGILERMKRRTPTKESILERLEKRGVVAVHDRVEDYPRREYYEGIHITFEPIAVATHSYPSVTVPTPVATASVDALVTRYAARYGIDASLVYAVIKAESDFNVYAVSPAGARGLMQLMPGTAAEMGVSDIFDPAQNVAGGTQYLAKMLQLFDNDLSLALAAYNAGPGNVKRYGGIPPYKETRTYVERVLRYESEYARRAVGPIVLARAAPVEASALPRTRGKFYTIHLQNGLTQPAEVIVDAGNYYLMGYKDHTARIQKVYVKEIIEST